MRSALCYGAEFFTKRIMDVEKMDEKRAPVKAKIFVGEGSKQGRPRESWNKKTCRLGG